MKKTKLLSFIAFASLATSVAAAAELYTDSLYGSELLPSGTYGSVTTTTDSYGRTLTADKIVVPGDLSATGVIGNDGNSISTHTISLWLKTPSVLADVDLYDVATAGALGYTLRLKSDGKVQYYQKNAHWGSGWSTVTTQSTPVSADSWHHLALAVTRNVVPEVDNTTTILKVEIFINGTSAGRWLNNADNYGTDFTSSYTGTDKVLPSNLNYSTFSQIKFTTDNTYAGIYIDNTALDATTVQSTAITSLNYEMYANPLNGTVSLPQGTYDSVNGHITTTSNTYGEELDGDKIQAGLDIAKKIAENEFQFYTHTTGFWFKAGDTPVSDTAIYQATAKSGGTVGTDSFTLSRTTSNFLQLSIEGRTSDTITSSTALTSNTWHHIAVSVEDEDGIIDSSAPGSYTIFLNGEQVATKSSVNLRINGDTPGQIKFFDGLTYSGIYVTTQALDEVAVQTIAVSSLDYTLTPAIGIEVVQTGTEATWTVEEEVGVKKYQIVDATTDEILETVVADGSASYKTTVTEDVMVKLVVVDNSGMSQTFLPEDGNKQITVYDLEAGWNLIAVTGENADFSGVESTWTWNGTSYQITTSLQPTQAVWVYSETNSQLIVESDKTDATITLDTGWNMVGPVENCEVPEGAHAIYSWNQTYSEVLSETNTLIEGVGYWIFSL